VQAVTASNSVHQCTSTTTSPTSPSPKLTIPLASGGQWPALTHVTHAVYTAVIGLGAVFALSTVGLVWLDSKYGGEAHSCSWGEESWLQGLALLW